MQNELSTRDGWRVDRTSPSLPESHRTIAIASGAGFWRKLLAFSGPGYLVAVGYMDPGLGDRFGRRIGDRYTLFLSINSAFEFNGDPAASALRAARYPPTQRDLARRATIILAAGFVRALDNLRAGDLRLRFGRSHRFRDRIEFTVSNPARDSALHHGMDMWPCSIAKQRLRTSKPSLWS